MAFYMSEDGPMTLGRSAERMPGEAEARLRAALPGWAQLVLGALEGAGYEAWVVGGFVRDGLLGRPSHDVDIATDARWQEVQRVAEAAGLRTHETGVKHGTLTVTVPLDAAGDVVPAEVAKHWEAVEVTTYRIEGPYEDGRRPSSVTAACTIEEDLARRDFTMNALAFHPARGIADPYGGAADMAAGIIRIVGDPDARFAEDGLRILRACRFASQLGFALEGATYEAMLSHKHLLARVSTERITHELDAFVAGAFVHDALMATWEVLAFAVPELAAMARCPQRNPYHVYDVLEHTAWAMQRVPPTRLLRWAALCHDMGKPAAAFRGADGIDHFYGHAEVGARLTRGLLGRLLMGTAFQDDVVRLVRAHDDEVAPTPKGVRRALARLDGDAELFRALCQLKRADALAHSELGAARAEQAAKLEAVLDEVLAAEDAFTVAALAVGGRDALAAGCPKGPAVGALLDAALEAVIDGQVPNEQEALRTFMREQVRRARK